MKHGGFLKKKKPIRRMLFSTQPIPHVTLDYVIDIYWDQFL